MLLLKEIAPISCVPTHSVVEPRCGSAAETPNCLLVGRLGALTLKLMVCMGEFWNMEPPESRGKKSPGFMLISNYHVYIYMNVHIDVESYLHLRVTLAQSPFDFFSLSSKLSDRTSDVDFCRLRSNRSPTEEIKLI